MAYNNLSRIHRVERIIINTVAAAEVLAAVLQGAGVAHDVQVLRNDQAAAAYYDHLSGTTPAMVADEKEVLDRDEAALRADSAGALLELFTAAGILYGGNKLVDLVDRPLPDQVEPVADQNQD